MSKEDVVKQIQEAGMELWQLGYNQGFSRGIKVGVSFTAAAIAAFVLCRMYWHRKDKKP